MQNKHLTKFNKYTIKVLDKLGREDGFFNLLKGIYEKPTVNSFLMASNQTLSPRMDIRQECPLLYSIQHQILEVLAE
jgi:hypothetical protein